MSQVEMQLNGPTLLHDDFARLARQRRAVWGALAGGAWLTLHELAEQTGHPEASVSARVRDFRKAKFGGHRVDRRRRFGEGRGTWEYRLAPAAAGAECR